MSDNSGLKLATEKGIKLGEVGQRVVFENDYLRIWEIIPKPGEVQNFHLYYHPYIVISLGGGVNEIESVFGDKRMTNEPLGAMVFMNDMRRVHKLTNKAAVPYASLLIELKHIRCTAA
ncbi:MAG TPA: hypothetical protein VJR71_05585 [Pseudolabrys sp.]|nr:hypothetical protein [Pseudolabrys sp.]